MAFKLVNSVGGVVNVAGFEFTSSGTIANGAVVIWGTVATGRVGIPTAGTDDTVVSILGASVSAGTDGGQIRIVPFVQGQLWEADCTNNSSTTQIGVRCALTDSVTLNNLADSTNGSTATFLIYGVVGAAADKKVVGEFLRVPYIAL